LIDNRLCLECHRRLRHRFQCVRRTLVGRIGPLGSAAERYPRADSVSFLMVARELKDNQGNSDLARPELSGTLCHRLAERAFVLRGGLHYNRLTTPRLCCTSPHRDTGSNKTLCVSYGSSFPIQSRGYH
jgi:hypothetical protein